MADVALPLDTATSTRLIVLEPGAYYYPIRCRLGDVDLDDDPEYEAISYTWGDANDVETVHVNGLSLQMRSNLSSFLRRLRHISEEKTFWVDALSISQTDLNEKSRQVAMIGRVFKQATCVRAWVGEHADNSEALFKADFDPISNMRWKWVAIIWTRLGAVTPRFGLMWLIITYILGSVDWETKALSSGLDSLVLYLWFTMAMFWLLLTVLILRQMLQSVDRIRELWYQVPVWRSFLLRPWFERTWIVQEVALARNLRIYCGHDSLPWEDLISARVGGRNERGVFGTTDERTYFRRLGDCHVILLDRLRCERQARDIITLAFDTQQTRCTDQRDRIYALLSMESSHWSSEPIVPDYTISVPELFVPTMRRTRVLSHGEPTDPYALVKGLGLSWSQYYVVYRMLDANERLAFMFAMWNWLQYSGLVGALSVDPLSTIEPHLIVRQSYDQEVCRLGNIQIAT